MSMDFVPYEGIPCAEADSNFEVFARAMHRQLASATCLEPIHLGRKTCLSCGAIQSVDGVLPCGH